ncbi:MAG TPA: hypothetical protein VEK11_04585 [Thermoanaerobaculia bacterium]|nr:hypothetical protein [Thermoanaerobaculia bacterium]
MLNTSFNRAGGPITITIVVGHNQMNVHRMFLWDANLANPEPIPRDAAENYQVGPAGSVDQRVMSWEVRIAASTPTTVEPYSVTVSGHQDGQTQQIDQLIGTMTLGVQVNGAARITLV